jgi:CheY-like chemotaxis protein
VVEEIAVDVPRAGRVLVVDDNATNRRVAELLLRAIGMEVACVEDGNEAVEAFLSGAFDVILMDMMMPVMDGITATMAIRNIERRDGLERTVIIMLTANILPQHISASLDAGADLHLPKPLSASSLFEALSKVGSFAEQQAVVSRNVA